MSESNDAKKGFIDRQYFDFRTMITRLPFVSDRKAVFYAGGIKNWQSAANYAQKNNMRAIQETKGGQFLNQIDTRDTFEKNKYKRIWDNASRKYASQVEGSVKTFVAGADNVSIFRRVELPTLLNNKKVEQINGIDRTKLREQKHKTYNRLREQGLSRKDAAQKARNTTHRKVAVAEIRQDIQRAKQTNSAELRADAQQRLSALRAQNKTEVRAQAQKVAQSKKQEARQDIKAKIDVLRDRKLKAELSKDRSQRVEARKSNTADVQKLRSEQHAKIRAQKVAQTKTQSKQQTVQKSVTPSTQTRKNARVHAFVKPSERSTAEKVSNPSEAKAELKQAMADKKVTHINGINKSRLNKSLETYKAQAVKQGATKENAAKIANNRLYHLMARHGQIRDRAKAFKDASQKRTLAHSSRTVSLQDSIISDRKSAAQILGKQYKGVEAKSGHLRTATIKYGSERIRVMGQFAKNVKQGHVKPNEVASVKKRAQSALTRYAQTQFKGQRTHNQSKSETAKVNAPKTATQGHAKGMRMGHGRSR
jgi:hypothetical protein